MSATVRPEMRAGQMKADLESLAPLPRAQEIRAALRASTLQTIESASRTAWLPFELDVEINEAVCRVLGEDATRAWNRDAFLRSCEGPLLGPFIRGSVKVLGLTPSSWLHWSARLWATMMRGCGDWSVTAQGASEVNLQLLGSPAALAGSRAFLVGLCGVIDGALAVGGFEGRAEVLPNPTTATVSFKAVGCKRAVAAGQPERAEAR